MSYVNGTQMLSLPAGTVFRALTGSPSINPLLAMLETRPDGSRAFSPLIELPAVNDPDHVRLMARARNAGRFVIAVPGENILDPHPDDVFEIMVTPR